MKKNTIVILLILTSIVVVPVFSADQSTDSGVEFEVGLYPSVGNGLTMQGLEIAVKNIGDTTAHNVTLIDLNIEGNVLYNNREAAWYRDVEPGHTLINSPYSLLLGFGIFKATITVTCDEGITGTGTGNGLILGALILVP